MAITNAQQYKQLVNPPLDGKRPGYRGDAAARSTGAAQSGRADPGPRGDPGEGRARDSGVSRDTGGYAPTKGQYAATSPDRFVEIDQDVINREKEYRDFIRAYNKKPPFVGPAASFLRNIIPGNTKLRSQFINQKLQNEKIKDFYENLSEDEKNNFEVMQALSAVGYDQYAADMGSPGLLYSGNVGNLEKFVTGKDAFGNTTYGYREKTGDGGGGDGIMSDYERRLLELENQLKNQQAAAPTTTTNPFAFRFLADGGRAEYRVGGAPGREYDQGSPKSSSPNQGPAGGASAGGNYGGNRNPDQTYGGGSGNQPPQKIKIPKPIKDAGNTAGELMFLKNVFELNPVGIMKNIGTKMFLDKLISDADTQQDQNMMLADVSAMDLKRKNQFKNLDYGTAMDIGMINPTMTQEEFEGVKSGEITEPTGQFARDGGRIGAMDGGIMNADVIGGMMDGNMDEMGRQMYGLGKLVKKVTRGVKKIVKSPIGKAAIGAALFKFGGGLGGLKTKLFGSALPGALGRDAFMGMAGKQGSLGLLAKLGLTKGYGAMMPTAMGGLALASLTPFLFQGDDEEENFDPYRGPDIDIAAIRGDPYGAMGGAYRLAADGGLMRTGYQEGGDVEPVAKKTMPLIDMDGKEKDYRETGGFVDMGRMERADDVPARLSKNEFVFTADAVRNAGEGDIDKGAEVMYNMMKNLEAGGEVSEESQGLEGARKMFQTSQRLGEVI